MHGKTRLQGGHDQLHQTENPRVMVSNAHEYDGEGMPHSR